MLVKKIAIIFFKKTQTNRKAVLFCFALLFFFLECNILEATRQQVRVQKKQETEKEQKRERSQRKSIISQKSSEVR